MASKGRRAGRKHLRLYYFNQGMQLEVSEEVVKYQL